MCARVGKV
jgi:hypothetical protein